MIARDNATAFKSSASSFTDSFTCSGNNRILYEGILVNGQASDVVPTITYAGVSMAKIAQQGPMGPDNEWIYLFVLTAPASGANNIVTSLNTSAFTHRVPVSYTGAAQSGQPDNSTSDMTLSAATYSTNITPVADNCWMLSWTREDGLKFDTATQNKMIPNTNADVNPGDAMFDTGPITPPASTSITYALSSGTGNWESITVSIAPFAPSTTLYASGIISQPSSATDIRFY